MKDALCSSLLRASVMGSSVASKERLGFAERGALRESEAMTVRVDDEVDEVGVVEACGRAFELVWFNGPSRFPFLLQLPGEFPAIPGQTGAPAFARGSSTDTSCGFRCAGLPARRSL